MNHFLSYFILSLSIASGFFTLGSISSIYILRKTKIVKNMLLFILSITLVNIGFLLRLYTNVTSTIFQMIGVILNIIIVPKLVSILLSINIGKKFKRVIFIWNGIIIICALLYPFISDPEPVLFIVNIQLITTILISLILLAIKRNSIPKKSLKLAVSNFLIISFIFLCLLLLDILITKIPISALQFFDNLSTPIYMIVLNIGSFIFTLKNLNITPLSQHGKLTTNAITKFSLTKREIDIIENLLMGKTNKKLAEDLFISKKTVENHLYNIYQKMELKNRMELIQTFKIGEKE